MRYIIVSMLILLNACAVNPVDVTPSAAMSVGACTTDTDYVALDVERVSVLDVRSDAALISGMQALQDRRSLVISHLPSSVRDDKVVKSVLDLLITRKSEASKSIRIKLRGADQAQDAVIDTIIKQAIPAKLSPSDFKNLFQKLVSPNGADHSSRIITYESAYFQGKFIDRFGTKLPQPTLALTITDQEIGAVLSTFIEALADDLFSATPVWMDDSSNYYPGANGNKLTFLSFPGAPATVKLVATGCGMTKLKMEALSYLSGKASTWAAGETGFVLGTLGGVSAGPVLVLGKFSIGDNKTLQTVAQTILASAAKRATFEGVKDVLLNINQPASWNSVADVIDSLVFGKS